MRRWILFISLGAMLLGLAACNLPAPSTPTVNGVDYIRTAAAKTLDAVSTAQIPRGTPGVEIPTASSPASTLSGGSVTLTPSKAPAAATPASGTAKPCDQAAFLRDVSIPDGTFFLPGTKFTKTWELKNAGTCSWNSLYSLVFANEGDLMGAAITKPLIPSGAVAPGDTVQISVDLAAPMNQGDYKSNWRMRNPNGNDFSPAGKPFWAAIKVTNQLVLIDNICNASWRNSSADLGCPGKPGDAKGAVSRVDNPKFSSGYQDDEPAIQIEPQQINDGILTGQFPPYLVGSANTQFRTIVGCAFDAKACDAKVKITAQSGSDPELALGEWLVTYKNEWVIVNADLAAKGMAGKSVTLRFTVMANGAPTQDRVLFLNPSFVKP